jgi:tetratricopeptide (TPR) repeat protein
MESHHSLSTQEKAELAMFLFDDGSKYYGQRRYNYAITRFAQSLSAFEQLNMPNYAWIASLLYFLGSISLNQQQASIALNFFRAAAQVQQRAASDESGADLLLKISQATAQLGHYAIAQQYLENAKANYQAIGLHGQAQSVQTQIEHMIMLHEKHAFHLSQDDLPHPHEFLIQVSGQIFKKLSVGADGNVQWFVQSEINYPLELGLTDWEIICVN